MTKPERTEEPKNLVDLKTAFQSAPILGMPDMTKPVDQRGYMTSMLLQKHEGKQRTVAYFSSKLDYIQQFS